MLSPDLNWRFAPRWRHDCISGIFAEVGKLNDVRVTKLGANQKGVFLGFGGLPASCEAVLKSFS